MSTILSILSFLQIAILTLSKNTHFSLKTYETLNPIILGVFSEEYEYQSAIRFLLSNMLKF